MIDAHHKDMLAALHEIRDGQREIIQLLAAQRGLAEEQLKKSGERIARLTSLVKLMPAIPSFNAKSILMNGVHCHA